MFQKHFKHVKLFKGSSDSVKVARAGVSALVGASLVGVVAGALK